LEEQFLRLGLRLRLKENFDRFNFAIYKEKEMADFRRLFTVLALVALFVGLASAQGGLSGGSTMSCSSTTTVTPTVRAEGFTEQVGDIVLSCTGGSPVAFGLQIPQANITVFLNTQVTSRLFSSSGFSEALLLIDEPGSTTVSGYGASLPQSVCTTPTTGGCPEFVGNTPANGAIPAGFGVPVTASLGTVAAPNVFSGVVSGNQVTFYGVPILPPSTTGTRIYRITNIRANANGISGGGPTPGTITGSVSISPGNAFTINQPLNTLAFVQSGLSASLRNLSDSGGLTVVNAAQCSTNNGNGSNSGNGFPVGILRFAEKFPTAFKTRMAILNAATSPTVATTAQNIPGQVYNSESGFTLNVNPTNGSTGVGVTAGLADFGTRLKAVFNNIPSGVSVFVSTTNVTSQSAGAATGVGNPYAALVISETVPDSNSPAVVSATTTSASVGYAPVTVVNGTGVAVWEVLSNNYTVNQNFDFSVFINYSGGAGTNTPAAGNLSVSQSLAPNATNGAFSATSATSASTSLPIPRFADTSAAATVLSISICQTTLLFPYLTTAAGFDTGIAISNTSQDPFGTTPQTGSCTLSWYQAGTGGTNPPNTTTAAIPGGTSFTTLASATTNAGASFTGYMFAVCNFQYAHGYAAITDVGARGIFASYLALVVPSSSATSRTGGTPETLTH
jgi:hypothetical protein